MYGFLIREYYADQRSIRLGNQSQNLATVFYKISFGNAVVPKEAYCMAEWVEVFFVKNRPRALTELKQLREVDTDMSGVIDAGEPSVLGVKSVRLSTGDRLI